MAVRTENKMLMCLYRRTDLCLGIYASKSAASDGIDYATWPKCCLINSVNRSARCDIRVRAHALLKCMDYPIKSVGLRMHRTMIVQGATLGFARTPY